MKKKLQKEASLLKEALKDLEKELKHLRSSKKELEKKTEAVSGKLGVTQDQEIRLRNEISRLMRQEVNLTQQKTSLKDKLLATKKKMEKIHSIEHELREV